MYHSDITAGIPLVSPVAGDAIARAVQDLRREKIAVALEILDRVDTDIDPSDEAMRPLVTEFVSQVIEAFTLDPLSPEAYRVLGGLDTRFAKAAFNLLFSLTFPDGKADVATLSDVGILAFASLLSAATEHDTVILVMAEAARQRQCPALVMATWMARRRRSGAASAAWPTPIDGAVSDEAAWAALGDRPLDVAVHRTLIRRLFEAGEAERALDALSVALALPIGENDKAPLSDEIAVIVPMVLFGHRSLLERDRVRLACAACPATMARTADRLREGAGGSDALLGAHEIEEAAAWLSGFGGSAERAVSAFPTRGGKPHVDIVWLEITNHCNQKCTFCPDMFREDVRTWLPLAEVKRLIDELAETMSVGSMQLNAYGEPLLHPNISEILAYLRERDLPWPTFFTSHGMTLVDKKLKHLSNNYPAGIAISLHNDSQESYAATRSAKIGDYETLVARVSGLLQQMVFEQAPSHLRLYQMVSNGAEDLRVASDTRSAFPDTPERMMLHVRKWEAIAADIAAAAPASARARVHNNSDEAILHAFVQASHGEGDHLPILSWTDTNGMRQSAFMSARPVGTYANLLLEYDPSWSVERKLLSRETCGFTAAPSLAIFATGRLGICCLDLNSTATFGSLSDYGSLREALTSREALQMFAQLSNGVATSRGCQICLGATTRRCG